MPVIKTSKLVTIDRHIVEQENLHPSATGEFTKLMHDLTFAFRLISSNVRRAGLNDILGLTENVNIHGERVRRLDLYANEVINKTMNHNGNLCVMASEESVEMIHIPNEYPKGKYVLVFDPLDGSGNIDVSITIGSIFGIYRRRDPSRRDNGNLEDILQPGYNLVAAGYILYGSSTVLVYTSGNGVNVFTYDPTIGEFLLTFESITIPKFGSFYSCNEGNQYKWSKEVNNYINYIKTPDPKRGTPYNQRYIATAVADVHRIIHYGGIYLYPAEINKPEGKIRLVYEANPLSFIIEKVGGKSTTGAQSILSVEPTSIHQTVPFFVGSPDNIDDLLMFLDGKEPV